MHLCFYMVMDKRLSFTIYCCASFFIRFIFLFVLRFLPVPNVTVSNVILTPSVFTDVGLFLIS